MLAGLGFASVAVIMMSPTAGTATLSTHKSLVDTNQRSRYVALNSLARDTELSGDRGS